MLEQFAIPSQAEVEEALLRSLLKHGGVIKEFGSGQEIVDEIANEFGLDERQRSAFLETIYRKENRVKKALLWHRLLFRAADALARNSLVTRPSQTLQLTKKREWLLTEKGFDAALILCKIPIARKEFLPIKSFEVQKIVKKLTETRRIEDYDPFDRNKRVIKTTKELALRARGFRQAVIEAYGFKCAVCGLKINSPDTLSWEVQAAHIVPHRCKGRDDIFNGIALCRIHHWAFDVGWFTLLDDYKIKTAPELAHLPMDFGHVEGYDFLRTFANRADAICLPGCRDIRPHENAIRWHRVNIFHQYGTQENL